MSRLVILITGSRLYDDPAESVIGRRLIGKAIADTIREAGADEVVIRHGKCRGADMIADEWARAMQTAGHNVTIDDKPADWDRFGKAAGFIRNAEMVQAGADICLAFPLGVSNGTRHCMELAKAAGIPVVTYEVEP